MRVLSFLLVAAIFGSGCTSFEIFRLRNDIARQAPEADIGEGYAMSFGRISIGLARWLSGLGDDEDTDVARAILSEVRRVEFGRFDVNGSFDAAALRMPGRLRHYLEKDNWHHLATIREESEAVWVVYKEGDAGNVVDLLAVVMDEEELVLAKISGDLNAVVAAALSQQDINIPFFGDSEEPVAENPAETEVVEAARELIP